MKAKLWRIEIEGWDSVVVNSPSIEGALIKGQKYIKDEKTPKEYKISEITLLAKED